MTAYRRKSQTRQTPPEDTLVSRNECGKFAYPSRKAARRANSNHAGDRMSPYRCPTCGHIHIGHLPVLVRRGHVSRGEYYSRAGADYAALPPKQRAILEMLRSYLDQHGHTPTVDEIRESVGLKHTEETLGRLAALERRGWIRRERDRDRAISIVRPWTVAA